MSSCKCNFVRHIQKHGVGSRSASECQTQFGFPCAKPFLFKKSVRTETRPLRSPKAQLKSVVASPGWLCFTEKLAPVWDRGRELHLVRSCMRLRTSFVQSCDVRYFEVCLSVRAKLCCSEASCRGRSTGINAMYWETCTP